MKTIFLLVSLLFVGGAGASGAFHETIVEVKKDGSYHRLTLTALSVSPALTAPNACNRTSSDINYPCSISVKLFLMGSAGKRYETALVAFLISRDPPNQCYFDGCYVSLSGAATIGDLVPLINYAGHLGKSASIRMFVNPAWDIVGTMTCIYTAVGSFNGGSSYTADCGPTTPFTTSCDVLDTDAVVDFGSFSNDVKSRQASGSFKVNCSGGANIRVKFSSNVANIALSEDKKLNASLKIRNSTPGSNEMESFIKVPSGEQEVFIDGDLKNNNTSHTGPFSASVVAIVEIA